MKQMTKEELIEYFIEQLGDNEILGKIMSIEQIRKKLNDTIIDVTYELQGNFPATVRTRMDGKVVIDFNLKKNLDINSMKNVIVHELLHVLSINVQGCILKTGLRQSEVSKKNRLIKDTNIAVNEGMTEALTDMIVGIADGHCGYNLEKYVYEIISIIVGEEVMLREFFSKETLDTGGLTNTLKKELVAKYRDKLGTEIYRGLKKVLQLSDIAFKQTIKNKIDKLGEFGKKIQSKINDEIYKTLANIMTKVIMNEPDIVKQVQEILALRIDRKDVNKMLSSVLENRDVDDKTMSAIFKLVYDRVGYWSEIGPLLQQLRLKLFDKKKELDDKFERLDKSNMTAEKIMEEYMTIYLGYEELMDKEKVYNWYVETGKIIPSQAFKIGIFEKICTGDKTQLDKRIDGIKYRKIGDYYQIIENGMPIMWYLTQDRVPIYGVVDENGTVVLMNSIYFAYDTEFSIKYKDMRSLFGALNLPEEKMEMLYEQIRSIYVGLEPTNFTCAYCCICICENLLEIQRHDNDMEPIKVYYKIQEDATLEKVEIRRRKRIHRRYVNNG